MSNENENNKELLETGLPGPKKIKKAKFGQSVSKKATFSFVKKAK
jgi:hypothetical protein